MPTTTTRTAPTARPGPATRWPVRELDVDESRTVKLRPGEDQDDALVSARNAIRGQMQRAIKAAPNEKLRRALDRRHITAEKHGKRGITLKRHADRSASKSTAKRKAALV